MSSVPPPLDVRGQLIEEGDMVAYPKGAGSEGAHLVVGEVVNVYIGEDRWYKPCHKLRIVPHISSEPRLTTQPRTIWMTRKCVIVSKGKA